MNTPNEANFLRILKNLLKIVNTNNSGTDKWEIINKLINRAAAIDGEENVTNEQNVEEKLENVLTSSSNLIPPPPPPPPPFSFKLFSSPDNLKKKPSFKSSQFIDNITTDQMTHIKDTDESKENNNLFKEERKNDSGYSFSQLKLPQQRVPKSQSKMKQLIWSKIQPNRIIGKENIWTRHCEIINDESHSNICFQEIEELFKTSQNPRAESQSKELNLKEAKVWHSSEKINLLDNKRSLNINIFLKQFRCSPDEVVYYLSKNENQELGLENLEGLYKLLPDSNEIELLKVYQGDIEKLAGAEKFLYKLIQVENYQLIIESLWLKEEFNQQIIYFSKSFDSIFKTSDTIYNSKGLSHMMLLICRVGNFINDVSYLLINN